MTVSPAIDLLHDSPLDLAVHVGLDDLLRAVRAVKAWTPRHDEVLDHVYRQRVARLLAVRPDPTALGALFDHLIRVSARRKRAAPPGDVPEAATRWDAFARVLDARRALIESATPDEILKRAHVKDILRLVRDAGDVGIAQADIGRELNLRAANLSRILSMLEVHQFVSRGQLDGRSNLIRLGPAAPDRTGPKQPEPIQPGARRFLSGALS